MTGVNYLPSSTENLLVDAGVQIPATYASTGTFTIGFGDSRTASTDTNSIIFSYRSNGDGLWHGVCSNNGVPSTGSGSSVSVGSFQRLMIYGNNTGYTFSIGSTTLGTISTNIPLTGMYPIVRVWNTSGVVSKSMYIDYFKMSRYNSTNRY